MKQAEKNLKIREKINIKPEEIAQMAEVSLRL